METLTRLVSESLARHGFDRPLDYRRLQWSRWFLCESHHSLLSVPSKPGVFALAEEVVDFGSSAAHAETSRVETAASAVPRSGASGPEHNASLEADSRRMLAVSQFFEDDDMAFVLDRMVSFENPMRSRLISGRYFVRYVVIEDPSQRRSICAALNQWIVSSAEKATGIGTHFATSLEMTERNITANAATSAHVETAASAVPRPRSGAASDTDSGATANIHCPFPSGF